MSGLQESVQAQTVQQSISFQAQGSSNPSTDALEDEIIQQVTSGKSIAAAPSVFPANATPLPPQQVPHQASQPSEATGSTLKVGQWTLPTRLSNDPIAASKSAIVASTDAPVEPQGLKPSSIKSPSIKLIDATVTAQLPTRGTETLTPPIRNPVRPTSITPPSLAVQGVYIYQQDRSTARARASGVYPLSSNAIVGATVDLVTGNAFSDSPSDGININELYVAVSPREIPGLRLVVGQLDLTSYFDRNSFSKDGATHFFNPLFQTNPALSATGIGSRPGALLNLSLGDYIEAKAAVFSSSRGLSDFALNAFAGEVGVRAGNLIVRGTYASDRDGGSNTGFNEIFSLNRGNDRFGILRDDREEAYGVNAELFVPTLKLGLFGRYGRYNNLDLDRGSDTYTIGLTRLDAFVPHDRLGVAYGRALSNRQLREQSDRNHPDLLEVFYDARIAHNLRFGLSFQARDAFSETSVGVRLKTEFDVLRPANRAE